MGMKELLGKRHSLTKGKGGEMSKVSVANARGISLAPPQAL